MPTRTRSPRAMHAPATVLAPASLTPDRFAELAAWDRGPCLTITSPIDEGARRAPEILLKDLARVADGELTAQGIPPSVVAELLAPSGSPRHVTFEDESIRGVAMLTGPGQALTLAMRSTPPALVHVGERFVVTPLLAEVVSATTYHLLALSEHRVRLFRGNARRLELVRVAAMPQRLEGLSGQQRMRRGHGAGRTAGVIHGGGWDHDLHLDRLRRYFRDVDDAVAGAVHATHSRLFVAGVRHELSIYRDVSRVERLATIEVGNPDRLSAAALYERCASTIEDVVDRPRRARLRDALESGPAVRSLPEIVDACAAGRVDSLFVRPDRLAWADPLSGGRAATAEQHAGDVEWHSEIIGGALLHGARVFAAQPAELPEGVSAIASVRY